MLNQTLNRQTLQQIINLSESRNAQGAHSALVEIIQGEADQAYAVLAKAHEPIELYRAQGAIEAYTELLQLLVDPLIYKDIVE